jgi:hypothetical protein
MNANLPADFRRFRNLYNATRFGKAYGFRVSSAADPDGSKHAADFGRDLVRLQELCDAGDWRVVVHDDEDWGDMDWDETGKVKARLQSGEYVCIGVVLERRETWTNERTGEQEDSWESVDSVWNIIGTREWALKMAQCSAASFIPADA